MVVVPYAGPLVPRLEEAGAEVVIISDLPVIRRQYMNVGGLLYLVSSLRSVWWLAKLVRRRNVALVHSNTLAVLLVGLAAVLSRRPQVWHVHEITVRPRGIALLLATLSSAMSTLVIANSRTTADHYRCTRIVTSTPIRIILNGIDESRLLGGSGTSLRSLLRAGSRDVVFTLIGRVNALKGHSVFLDAAERLAGERLAGEVENVRFLMVGDSFAGQSHWSEAVDERVRSSETLRERAIRLPHTAEVKDVYAASDVVVVPSVEPESFGLVAAEAMAAGLPVIASRIGALPEIVEEHRTGLLAEPNDAASLLAAMRELSQSPDRRVEMGRRGRARFEQHFRVGRYVEQFARVYEELLAGV